MNKIALTVLTVALGYVVYSRAGEPAQRALPGELSAEQILNGDYPFPPSPSVAVNEDWTGFATNRLTPVPPPGVHPRVLFSPSEIPDIRYRINQTDTGKRLIDNLRGRVAASIGKHGTWENDVFEKLATGDTQSALKILNSNPKPNSTPGHYQPYFLYALVMESFDALVSDDAPRGRKVAATIANYARMIAPLVDERLKQPLADDVWRVKVSGPTTGDWSSNQGIRDLVGYHNLGYAYDFAAPFMTEQQRADVRSVISKVTAGRVWMGAYIPHHFRNWNWCAVGLGQPLLALAIEGEEGYDPRVFDLGVQIARDYLAYGISEKGSSTEAVGYTQFGLVWANPFFVAAARRGHNLLVQDHHRAMLDWYLQTMQPFAPDMKSAAAGDAEQSQRGLPPTWLSHGDGGDEGPAVWTLSMWKYFFPDDPKADFLWQVVAGNGDKGALDQRIHLIEPLIFATDPKRDRYGKPVDYSHGVKLHAPLTFFDPARGSLITRDKWAADATVLQLECRTDSVGASHEHADRGSFTLSALGRSWAKDNFRSVETRHHNSILIDGMGQGFWPGPGRWLELVETGSVLIASCDAKPAYDWVWPKQILTENPQTFERFKFPRWESYAQQAAAFQSNYAGTSSERDDRSSVVAHWKGFEQGDPRMWDEDAWPVRFPHNPVLRAFRTVVFHGSASPYMLVVDDIQKDEKERLYEWLMQTGMDTELVSINGGDIILSDADPGRFSGGVAKPKKGDRLLLVRILQSNDPARFQDYQSRPSIRLETFERKDTLAPEAPQGTLSGSRSFGLDKRLVIPSRSVSPDFKILIYPFRSGESLPETTWNEDHSELTVVSRGERQTFLFQKNQERRTRVSLR